MRAIDRAFIIAGLISLTFLVGISSCEYNEKTQVEIKPTKHHIASSLKESRWKITSYYDEHDETDRFLDYSFQFYTDGSVSAVRNNSVISGTWSTFNGTNDQVKVNFEFSLTEPFDELSDDWVVVESSESKLILRDLNSSSDDEDEIVFEKV